MKTQCLAKRNSTLKARLARAAAGWMCGSVCLLGQAQTPPPSTSADVQEVVNLSRQQMGDDVINSYLRTSHKIFHLSADDLVYLKSQGVSENVLRTMLETGAASPAATGTPSPIAPPTPVRPAAQPSSPTPLPAPAPALPPVEVNYQYFHDQLAPFGSWIYVHGAWYWRPDAAVRMNPDFRPYYDMGRWVETENGLFWQSDYVWGDIPFHYGRWVRDPGYGWLWYPEYEWAPAWVFWRHAEVVGGIGWAPLPVGAVIVEGGYLWHGVRVGLEFDFGFGPDWFVFVGFDHFHDCFFRMRGREWGWHVYGPRLHEFYHHSVVRNEFGRDGHGRLVNNGIGRERLDRATHNRVEHAGFQERSPVGNRSAAGGHAGVGNSPSHSSGTSQVYRPAASAPASSSRGGGSSGSHGHSMKH